MPNDYLSRAARDYLSQGLDGGETAYTAATGEAMQALPGIKLGDVCRVGASAPYAYYRAANAGDGAAVVWLVADGNAATPGAVLAAAQAMTGDQPADFRAAIGAKAESDFVVPQNEAVRLFMLTGKVSLENAGLRTIIIGEMANPRPAVLDGEGCTSIFPTEGYNQCVLPCNFDLSFSGYAVVFEYGEESVMPMPSFGCLSYYVSALGEGSSVTNRTTDALLKAFVDLLPYYGNEKPVISLMGLPVPSETGMGYVNTLTGQGCSVQVALLPTPEESGFVLAPADGNAACVDIGDGKPRLYKQLSGNLVVSEYLPTGWSEFAVDTEAASIPAWPDVSAMNAPVTLFGGGLWVQATVVTPLPAVPSFVLVPSDGSSSAKAVNNKYYCRFDGALNVPGVNEDPFYDQIGASYDGVTFTTLYIWPGIWGGTAPVWPATGELGDGILATLHDGNVYVGGFPQ